MIFPPLPEYTTRIKIERLQLPDRTQNTLLRAGINTLGDLLPYVDDLSRIPWVGKSLVTVINTALINLRDSLTDDRHVDWPTYWRLQGVNPVEHDDDEPDVLGVQLPESVKQYSIGHLHLPQQAYHTLTRAGAMTIGDLCNARTTGFIGRERLGAELLGAIGRALSSLTDAIRHDHEVDWEIYWKAMGIAVIPAQLGNLDSDEQKITALEDLIKAILTLYRDDRYWRVIQRRFGLAKTKKLTLEELSEGLAISRGRIRQIEQRGMAELRAILIDNYYVGRSYHIHPTLDAYVRSVVDILALKAHDLMGESDLFALLHQSLRPSPRTNPLLQLLFTLAGMRSIEFDNPDLMPVWQRGADDGSEQVKTIISALDSLLTRDVVTPMEDFDILLRVNKQLPKTQKLDLLELRRFLSLCSTIEQREDGLFWGKFEYLKSRGSQIYRLLSEAGVPLELAAMTRIINSALIPHGHHKAQERTLANHLVGDDRFVPVGRTGQWALKEWEHIDTRSILEVMENYLDLRNQAATAEDIFDYVRTRRPASRGSINMYLAGNPALFRKTDRTHWGLATWTETENAQIWSRSQVADFIAGFFKQQKVKEIPLKVLREALMEAAGVTSHQAKGLMMKNPAIHIRIDGKWGERIAVFQPQYKETVHEPRKITRKTTTIRDKVYQAVEQILQRAPGGQQPLSSLIEQLTAPPHTFHDKTLYLYLRQMPSLETMSIPGTKVKICRLKGAASVSFPQVSRIIDPKLRADIEHAIADLTEDNIDIGLFRLGREFEVIIKNCLIKGGAAGKLTLQPSLGPDPTKWKLVQMVDYAKNQDLITDLGAVNLLRQERNNRAHGGRPSLSERQALMNAAPYLAGLYIDYILHFSTLLQSY